MRILRSLAVAALAIGAGLGALPNAAKADWLGLTDGTYDVTLTCVLSSVIPCPSQIAGHGDDRRRRRQLHELHDRTARRSRATRPTASSSNSMADYQYSTPRPIPPFSLLDLRLDLSIPNPFSRG